MPLKPPVACGRCGRARPCGCDEGSPPVAAANPLSNYSTDEHRPWKKLYDKARWRHPLNGLRALILRRDPICKECNRNPSTIADHIRDHRGDERLFWNPNNLRGVCKECHDQKTMSSMSGRRENKQ